MNVSRSSPPEPSTKSVAILGAGIIGLCCAWRLADLGAKVTIFDPRKPGQGASWAAAGMLAPAFEVGHTGKSHPKLAELCLASAALWPDFADRLEETASQSIGYASGPSLAVAKSDEHAAHLDQLTEKLSQLDIPFEDLGVDRGLAYEPALATDLKRVVRLPTDGHADNRRVIKALLSVCERHAQISTRFRQSTQTPESLLKEFDQVLITAGWESKALLGIQVPLAPVSGQLLSVAIERGMPTRTIRAGNVYIAPKTDRIVIGATVEPGTVRTSTDDETLQLLREQASALCPSLRLGPVLETWFGVRPGLPDHAPIIGRTDNPYVFMATGHHRNGILLAPITAKLISELMLQDLKPDLADPFRPDRFAHSGV